MDVSGANSHVGDIVTTKGVQSFTTPRINYQVVHDPIDLDLNSTNAFRPSAKYRGKRWGFSAAGWFVRTQDSVSGRVSSPADVETPTQVTWETRSVLMWNELLTPVGRRLGIGASSFSSVWTNVTAPPDFTMTHSDAGPGLDWDPRQQTLRFGSAGLIVSFAF